MFKRLLLTGLLSLACISPLFGAHSPYHPNPTNIRIIPVEPTPESNTVKLEIIFPENSQVKMNEPVRLQLKVWGFSLRTNSDFQRKKELWNDPEGQSIHIIIDDRQFFSLNRANVKSLDSQDNFYNQIAEVTIPFNLSPGEHIVRAFPVRSYNESLKKRGTFAVDTFYFRSRENTIDQNLRAPFLTYNEPAGTFNYGPDQPVLLDFLISNTELSTDGYKVELTIDGENKRLLTRWVPYYIYGLQPGSHTIRLRLLDPQNKIVDGAFNDFKETIIIK